MAVNIKTPVVVENITLMCLRILQKLIKPPAPTSKKNKVSSPLGTCSMRFRSSAYCTFLAMNVVVVCWAVSRARGKPQE